LFFVLRWCREYDVWFTTMSLEQSHQFLFSFHCFIILLVIISPFSVPRWWLDRSSRFTDWQWTKHIGTHVACFLTHWIVLRWYHSCFISWFASYSYSSEQFCLVFVGDGLFDCPFSWNDFFPFFRSFLFDFFGDSLFDHTFTWMADNGSCRYVFN
jgi:hypothetical protein